MADERLYELGRTLATLNEGSPSDDPDGPSISTSPTPSRRRRLFNRITRPDHETRAGPGRTFNPQALDFVPSGRGPTKRKASSSARPGKTTPSTSRASGSDQGTSENPLIHAEDIFGPAALAWSNYVEDAPETTDEDDESGVTDLTRPDATPTGLPSNGYAANMLRERVNRAIMAVPSLLQDKVKRVPELEFRHSAILFSKDGKDATSQSDDFVKLRYLPLCPSDGRRGPITEETTLVVLPSHRNRIDATIQGVSCCRAAWPKDQLPVELFDLVTAFLSRDDVRSMRLVSREFEEKVSANLFASSVVPFNTELYDMMEEDSKLAQRVPRFGQSSNVKGKARAIDAPSLGAEPALRGLHWQNAKDDTDGKVYKGHGLRVFQGFGPYFRRFGMSFEVTEAQLARPPIKKDLERITSYHGSYDWPHEEYTRFAGLAGLERTADETLRMKAAFSNLSKVQEIGLSLDNGLGWLNGPDKSVHARVFQRDSPLFGRSRSVPNQQMQDAKVLWQAIQECHASIGVPGNPRELSMGRQMLKLAPSDISGLQDSKYANTELWSSITAGSTSPTISPDSSFGNSQYGVLYTTFSQMDPCGPAFDKKGLVPSDLRREQKEWLMETDWAQRAFLECYILAVVDNPGVFRGVKKLTLAKISSGLLPILSREAFWNALPAVSDVTIHVKPDWRTVERDNAGNAETCPRHPSAAVDVFYDCIIRDICHRPAITTLNIGWQAGGEHAQGIFTRNNHILPAPITQLEHSVAVNDESGLVFKFVEHLTLHNCWMTPITLQALVKRHAGMALRTLVLESVSLTANPRVAAGGQAPVHAQNHVIQALPPQILGAPWTQFAQGQPAPGLPVNLQQVLQNNAQHPAAQFNAAWQQFMNAPPQGLQQHMAQGPPPVPQFQPANAPVGAQPPGPVPAATFFGGVFPPPLPLPLLGFPSQNHLGAPPQPQLHMQQNAPAPSSHWTHWTQGHREGSWADVLDKVSPGQIFSDFRPKPAPWDPQPPEREKANLRSIILKSCGYVKISRNVTMDQFAMEAAGDQQHWSPWFRARQMALQAAMMTTTDRYVGRIVQHMSFRELQALGYAWGMYPGWTDRAAAEEVEYDGLLRGGTGRFSGEITRGVDGSYAQD